MSPTSTLRRIAAITFLTMAARGLVLPFLNLYLKSTGFTATQIGVIVSFSALVLLLVSPLLNILADRTHRHRRLYYSLIVANILALLGIVSQISQLFLAGSIIVRDSSDTSSAALLSQLTVTRLDEQKRATYGRLRAWGSFGWGVTTLISGRLFAAGGYPFLFVLSALLNLLVIPLVRVLPEHTSGRRTQQSAAASRSNTFYFYLISIFLFNVGANAIAAFSFIYFKENLGASNELIGIVSSVAALSEIPSMILIDRLLRRTNIRTTLVIGIVGQALLWIGYTALTGTAFLIPLMVTRGTFYTFFNVSSTLLVARISHPANVATNQALAQVTVPGLAVLLTSSVSGWLFDHAGPHVLFQMVALISLLAAALLLFARRQLEAEMHRMQTINAVSVRQGQAA
jgi:MFS transporter, PPP family, 3-phenylpropionic acid transporter